jgi:hypothetical protein
MGQSARSRFQSMFTAQRMAQSYHDLYRELATASR